MVSPRYASNAKPVRWVVGVLVALLRARASAPICLEANPDSAAAAASDMHRADPDGDIGDEPLGYRLKRASDALRAEVMATVLVPVGLGFTQYICLRALLRAPGQSNAELARQFSISPQAMSVVLRELQHRGLVTRPIHSCRARSLPAKLTSDGVKLAERADSAVREAERRFLGKLSVQDQRDFRRLIHVLGRCTDLRG